jgi:hypothetical protein
MTFEKTPPSIQRLLKLHASGDGIGEAVQIDADAIAAGIGMPAAM